MPDAMLQLAKDEGIKVEVFDFVPPVRGIYYAGEDTPPIIGLDSSLMSDSPLLRSVLAEELGHHFTTVGCFMPRQFYNHSDRLHISKIEFKAMRWAVNHLMPEDDLIDVIGSGLYEPWEIAEHFNVVEEFAKFRLRLFGAKEIKITASFHCRMKAL
ncbi:ImmA/IrrE family metallo-endopeptidase [Pelosinus sp. sgz500959]|uniref:ImmA/IrrE family metallo-endopeptidase n=1 Tax=Pelosinus sp. sgz500959 TaxID=3242472 RepID=UPI00366DDA25